MNSSSILDRTNDLIRTLNSKGGYAKIIAKIIDLENDLLTLKNSVGMDKEKYLPIIDRSVTIEENADDDGNIKQIPESVWIESLNIMLEVNVVAIVSELPSTTGLYTWEVLYRNKNEWTIHKGSLKVWVVPT